MTISAEVLDAMVAAGCTAKQIAAAVKADLAATEAKEASRREGDRQRKRAERDRKREAKSITASEVSRGHTVTSEDNADTLSPDKKVSHTLPKTNPNPLPPSPPKGGSSPTAKPTPRHRLESVLDPEHAAAVLDHRQKLRKPLTERAAKMMADSLAAFADPNAAADRMIAKGWLTIEAGWNGAPQAAASSDTSPDLVTLPADHPDVLAIERLRGKPVIVGSSGRVTVTRAEIAKAKREPDLLATGPP